MKTSRLQHCCDQPEYWEECRKPEETCCHSDSGESTPANAGVKRSKIITISIKNIFRYQDQAYVWYIDNVFWTLE